MQQKRCAIALVNEGNVQSHLEVVCMRWMIPLCLCPLWNATSGTQQVRIVMLPFQKDICVFGIGDINWHYLRILTV